MAVEVDLIVPLKPPRAGKSRLRGALGCSPDDETHAALVLALAKDTVTAARAAAGVRRVLVVAQEPDSLAALRESGVEIVGQPGPGGLNAAFRHGETLLREDDPDALVGALQADLPALRSAELDAAIAEAGDRRAFTADRQGTGTTLLLSGTGALHPAFGTGSAEAHEKSGALPLALEVPSLRTDVDTARDLALARTLGLGKHTAALLDEHCLAH